MSLRFLSTDEEAVARTPPASWSILTGIIMSFCRHVHVLLMMADHLTKSDYGHDGCDDRTLKAPVAKRYISLVKPIYIFFGGKLPFSFLFILLISIFTRRAWKVAFNRVTLWREPVCLLILRRLQLGEVKLNSAWIIFS